MIVLEAERSMIWGCCDLSCVQNEKIQALMTPSGKLRLPHRKYKKVAGETDTLSFEVPAEDISNALKAFELTRVPSNDW